MIKQIIITWIKVFAAAIAVTFLISIYYKSSYEIKCIIPNVIGTLVIAIVIELVKEVRTKLGSF